MAVHPLDLGARRPGLRLTAAQAVAGRLRDRILSGELADGEWLAPLDELTGEFAASKPTVRQGLQILEAEGLLSVRRGRLGGAVVHHPGPVSAAYAMELVLRRGDVPAQDMGDALRQIEPVCAGMCAARPDREAEVLPALRAVHAEGLAAVDRPADWPVHARRFHEELVRRCGNQTLAFLIGALESVCTARAAAWAQEGAGQEDFPVRDREFRRRGWDDHGLILTFIERGDADAAVREARRHLAWVPDYALHPTSLDG